MHSRPHPLLTTLVLLTLPGCATVYTQLLEPEAASSRTTCPASRTIPNVYSGSTFDLYCIPAENAGFFCLVDLPLSIAADTLLLPLTVPRQWRHGAWYNEARCRAQQAPATDAD